ncbi:hypothetical protein [Pseudomonas sp. NPDC089734]
MKKVMLLCIFLTVSGCSYFSFQEDNCTDNPQALGCDGEHATGHKR